jgi:hypothetical protein
MDFHPYGWATGPWELIDQRSKRVMACYRKLPGDRRHRNAKEKAAYKSCNFYSFIPNGLGASLS